MDNFISGGLEMNNKSRFLVASALAVLCAAVTANAYVFENFELANGAKPWPGDSGVIVTNGGVKNNSFSLYIPVLSTVTNIPSPTISDRKVWTDFFTVPRQFVSESSSAPTVDTNATAQFFVNSNGMWVTISGNGGTGLLTNVCTNVLVSGIGSYPTADQYAVFYHVSVLHDYAASNWSLFVNDKPLATNLHFIASGVSTHAWFQVQNLGGNSNNICWLDDFLITNKVATSGSGNAITNVVPGTTIPLADALAGFGTMQDPRKTNQTIGVSGTGVALTFGGGAGNGNYVMYGTPNFDLSSLVSNGVVSGNTFTKNSVLDGTTNRYFFKLLTVAQDGSVVYTNDETYAAYKQYRHSNKYSIVGVPVQITDRSMHGVMGTQLASGLSNGDIIQMTQNGTPYRYKLGGGSWSDQLGNDPGELKQWALGVGMVVLPYDINTSPSYFAGLKKDSTNAVSVTVANNVWNYLAWVHNDKTFTSNGSNVLGFLASTNDYIYIQTNGAANFLAAKYDGASWRTLVYPWNPITLTVKAGDGIVYKTFGGDKLFTSVGP